MKFNLHRLLPAALFLFLITAVLINFSGCSETITNSTVTPNKYKARTEAEFNTDASLKAIPGAVVYIDLEHLNSPASGVSSDTGPIGEDVISYSYTDSAVHRFKLGAEARFKVRLVNESGAVIYQLNNPGDTARVMVPAGDYKLYLTSLVNFGIDSSGTQAIFIQSDSSGSVLPQAGYHKEDLNTLMTTGKCIKCNLDFVLLDGKDLTNADIRASSMQVAWINNCKFVNANFYDTKLTNCIIRGSNFGNTNMYYVHFTGTTFTNTDLRSSKFETVHLDQATLQNCNLSYSTIAHTNLNDTYIRDCQAYKILLTELGNVNRTHIVKTNLKGSEFFHVSTLDFVCAESNLDSVKFHHVLYSKSTFQNNSIKNAYFYDINNHSLGGDHHDWTNNNFTGTKFSGWEDANSGYSSYCLLEETDFSGSNFTDASMIHVSIDNSDLCNTIKTRLAVSNTRYNGGTKCWP